MGRVAPARLARQTCAANIATETLLRQKDGEAVSEATTASAATAAVLSDGSIGTPSKKGVIVKPEVLHAHPGIKSSAAELPLPVLGYACLNCTLRHQKPTFFNNRTCRLATIKDPAKGIPFVSSLALQNCKDLMPILRWNLNHGIKFMRLSSEFFPWGNVHYKLCELPDYDGIKEALAEAGAFAREHNHRLTSHPSEFVKLAGQTNDLVDKSIADLELHSEMFDLLGYDATVWKHWNKINIHVGGTYGDKDAAIRRFAANFARLSSSCRLRLTVENDDRASMFSVADLKELHELTGCKLPIVFDFHHYRFCTGDQSTEEALRTAMSTWPPGVKPVVHWSESQGGKKEHAHSDYIGQTGRMDLFGLDAHIDVMIESKAKELSLLLYRDIVEHGNAGRDEYFVGIDVIEEEATRIEALKAAGKAVELSPVQGVQLEGVEIIPCNDKRLHGRSQRRNKPQRKAAASAAKADASASTSATGTDLDDLKLKRKRAPSKAAQAKAAAALAEAEAAAGSGDVPLPSPQEAEAAVAADGQHIDDISTQQPSVTDAKRKRPPSKATKANAAAALAGAEVAAAGDLSSPSVPSVPSVPEAEAAASGGGGKRRPSTAAKGKQTPSEATKRKAAAALAGAEAAAAGDSGDLFSPSAPSIPSVDEAEAAGGGKRRSSTTAKGKKPPSEATKRKTAAALADAEASAMDDLFSPSGPEAEAAAGGGKHRTESADQSRTWAELEDGGASPDKAKRKRPPSKKVKAEAAAARAEAESTAGGTVMVPSSGEAQAAATANARDERLSSAAADAPLAAKRRRGRSAAAAVEAAEVPPPALGDQPDVLPTVAEEAIVGGEDDDDDGGDTSREPPKTKAAQSRAARAARALAASAAATEVAVRRKRSRAISGK